MPTASYIARAEKVQTYFDRTAVEAWARLTSDAPVSGIRATVRAGRDRMRATLLDWLPLDLTGVRILDAGCGTGAFAVAAAARGAEVVAVDLSPTLIALARERAAEVSHDPDMGVSPPPVLPHKGGGTPKLKAENIETCSSKSPPLTTQPTLSTQPTVSSSQVHASSPVMALAMHCMDVGEDGRGETPTAIPYATPRVSVPPPLWGRTGGGEPQGIKRGQIVFLAGDMLDPALGTFDHVVSMDCLIHYSARDAVKALATLAPRVSRSMLFTFAPRTALLSVMHATGRLFPRTDRAPAIEPVSEAVMRRAIADTPTFKTWHIGRTQRVATGFYISQALELVAP